MARPDHRSDPTRDSRDAPPPVFDTPFTALWLRDQFAAINCQLDRIKELIMASAQQLNDELILINAATTKNAETLATMAATDAELAADVQDLIDKLAAGTIPDDAVATLKAARESLESQSAALATTSEALKATAAKHTPGSQP